MTFSLLFFQGVCCFRMLSFLFAKCLLLRLHRAELGPPPKKKHGNPLINEGHPGPLRQKVFFLPLDDHSKKNWPKSALENHPKK